MEESGNEASLLLGMEDTPLGSFLVHDPVATLPAADGVTGSDLVLTVALWGDRDEHYMH